MKTILIASLICITSIAFTQNKSSLLWEISGNGLTQPSYLFGTIHIIPKKQFFFTPAMKESFNSCEKLVMEIDNSSVTLKQQIEIGMKALLSDGQTLKGIMGDSAYTAFISYAIDSLNIKEKKTRKYNKLKPFYVTGLVLMDYIGKSKGYEKQLTKYAKRNKMEIDALESIEFQMNLVEKLPLENQAELFLDLSSLREFDQLVNIYVKQDLDAMYKMSNESYSDEEAEFFVDAFINDRNADWIPKIEKFASKQATFIAVGALHLPGEKGVIELLRSKGYSMKPIL
jgi:uncharacterized protein